MGKWMKTKGEILNESCTNSFIFILFLLETGPFLSLIAAVAVSFEGYLCCVSGARIFLFFLCILYNFSSRLYK